MPILFSGVIACEEDVQTCDIDEKHSRAQDMASRVRCDPDAGDGMCGVEVDGFDLWESGDMILFRVE